VECELVEYFRDDFLMIAIYINSEVTTLESGRRKLLIITYRKLSRYFFTTRTISECKNESSVAQIVILLSIFNRMCSDYLEVKLVPVEILHGEIPQGLDHSNMSLGKSTLQMMSEPR